MHPSPGGAESGTTFAGVDIEAPSVGGDDGEEAVLRIGVVAASCGGAIVASCGGAVVGGMRSRRMSSTRVLTASKASEYFDSSVEYRVVISANPVVTCVIFFRIQLS